MTEIPPSATLLPFTLTPLSRATAMPSPTPVLLAALVNGEPITQAEYQAELTLYRAAPGVPGTDLAKDGERRVLDDLISQVLLAQGAAQEGYILDDAAVQERMDALAAKLGSGEALNEWIVSHGYMEETFRQALGRDTAAAWMRDKIIAAVPETAEQIHARQILLYNQDQASQVLDLVRAGTEFATLAEKYDPVAGGDLGWFPRGYLTVPALEKAVFALQEGQISEVVRTRLGYHIVQVIERDPQHPLAPGARLALQTLALHDWLEQRRSQSQIQILLS